MICVFLSRYLIGVEGPSWSIFVSAKGSYPAFDYWGENSVENNVLGSLLFRGSFFESLGSPEQFHPEKRTNEQMYKWSRGLVGWLVGCSSEYKNPKAQVGEGYPHSYCLDLSLEKNPEIPKSVYLDTSWWDNMHDITYVLYLFPCFTVDFFSFFFLLALPITCAFFFFRESKSARQENEISRKDSIDNKSSQLIFDVGSIFGRVVYVGVGVCGGHLKKYL